MLSYYIRELNTTLFKKKREREKVWYVWYWGWKLVSATEKKKPWLAELIRCFVISKFWRNNCIFYFVDQNFGDSNSNFPFVDARNFLTETSFRKTQRRLAAGLSHTSETVASRGVKVMWTGHRCKQYKKMGVPSASDEICIVVSWPAGGWPLNSCLRKNIDGIAGLGLVQMM